MHCQLLVPDLFWPDRDEPDIYRELELPALLQLLSKGRGERSDFLQPENWLCEQFGLEQQSDWPVAAYSLLADGGKPGERHWLRADPVHLKAEGGRLVLADSGNFAISQLEAEGFTDSLNRHFGADGLCFHALRPDRWYLSTQTVPALKTTALAEAAGKSVDPLLPQGADNLAWRTHMNEAQMLLHAHPANEAREAAGEIPVNSVWLWGGGKTQQAVSSQFTSVWARDAFAAGLAQAAHLLAPGLPADAAGLLAAAPREGVHLAMLDQLRTAAHYADAYAWREALLRLERDWFAPLLDDLRQERIGMLTLHATGPGGTLSVESVRGDLRRFWRRARPLASLA